MSSAQSKQQDKKPLLHLSDEFHAELNKFDEQFIPRMLDIINGDLAILDFNRFVSETDDLDEQTERVWQDIRSAGLKIEYDEKEQKEEPLDDDYKEVLENSLEIGFKKTIKGRAMQWLHFPFEEFDTLLQKMPTCNGVNIKAAIFAEPYTAKNILDICNHAAGLPLNTITDIDEQTLRAFYKGLFYHEIGHMYESINDPRLPADYYKKEDLSLTVNTLNCELKADQFSLKQVFNERAQDLDIKTYIELIKNIRTIASLQQEVSLNSDATPRGVHSTGNLFSYEIENDTLAFKEEMSAERSLFACAHLNALISSAFVSIFSHTYKGEEPLADPNSAIWHMRRGIAFDIEMHPHNSHIVRYKALRALLENNQIKVSSDEHLIANNYIKAMDELVPALKDDPKVKSFLEKAREMDNLFLYASSTPESLKQRKQRLLKEWGPSYGQQLFQNITQALKTGTTFLFK